MATGQPSAGGPRRRGKAKLMRIDSRERWRMDVEIMPAGGRTRMGHSPRGET